MLAFASMISASRDFVRHTGSPQIEQVIPGAQLVVRYSVYRHHGIYAGAGRVIHYAGWIRGRRGLIETNRSTNSSSAASLR
jgi:hypothetical protein